MIFELFADVASDLPPHVAATGARFFIVLKIVVNFEPREMSRELSTPVRMTFLSVADGLNPTRFELLAGFLGDARFVDRELIEALAEEQQLAGIEAFALRSVEALEERGGRLGDRLFHREVDRFLYGCVDRLLLGGQTLRQLLRRLLRPSQRGGLLDDQAFQQRRIVRRLREGLTSFPRRVL